MFGGGPSRRREEFRMRTAQFMAVVGAVAMALAASSLRAETVTVASAGGADSTPAFIAKEEGFYAKHGLDGNAMLMPLMPTIPPALMANAVQVGAINPTTLLQAIDGGLDLVALAGGSVIAHRLSNIGAVAGADSGIKTPQDFVGKKVAVPGLGAVMHVMFRYWLAEKGVDFKKVEFVEVSLPNLRDVLSKGTVDGIVAIDPVMSQIVESKVGAVWRLVPDMPEGETMLVYAATRDWAGKHPKEVASFRAAIAEGAAFVTSDPEKAREDLGKYLKFSPAVLKTIKIGVQEPHLTSDQLAWWVDVMEKQGMLNTKIDVTKIIIE
jgi:NitT/TauT family transport system substrate-binding protein